MRIILILLVYNFISASDGNHQFFVNQSNGTNLQEYVVCSKEVSYQRFIYFTAALINLKISKTCSNLKLAKVCTRGRPFTNHMDCFLDFFDQMWTFWKPPCWFT